MTLFDNAIAKAAWYAEHGCHHAHCPNECESPQPILAEGKMYCGRCWFEDDAEVEMTPCNPETCLD